MNGHIIVVMTRKRKKHHVRANGASSYVTAADFKARCLHLMDRVCEAGLEYVVTKHGKPVARLAPYRAPEKIGFFGSMKGTVLKYERPFDPIDGDYDINRT